MQPIIFQIIDWSQYNEKSTNDQYNNSNNTNDSDYSNDTDDSSDKLEKELFGKQSKTIDLYKIRLYGRTEDNKSVIVNVNNYTPFFYIKVNKDWTESKIRTLIGYIKTKISKPKVINGLKSFDTVLKKDLYGFTGYKDFKFVRLIFHNMYSYKSFENWISKNKVFIKGLTKYPIKLDLYESNIEPFIRCMHIRKLNACGWVKITKYESYNSDYSHCGIAIQTNWTNLEPYDSTSIQKFIIASWDIECMSWSGNFPQAIDPDDKEDLSDDTKQGDPIIQIGTIFSYYGESEPFAKYILTLGGCEKVNGLEDVNVKSFKSEKNVLLAWTKLIQKYDPDVITGWNINGFDFQYIYDRARKLKILDKFSKLSRLCDEKSLFKEKTLSSSALGDNLLKYFDMGGRIIIDMMKERQRESKLDSYKLDFVASTYIKEKMIMCEIIDESKSIIYTSSIYGIKIDDYINITWDDGFNENKYDMKYKIIELNKVDDNELLKLIKSIESYEKYNDYIFKKPKILYKLIINGVVPCEIFEIEEGNEPMWKNIKRQTIISDIKIESKLYFQIDGYADKKENNIVIDNENKSWIDIKYNESIIQIRGNKIFWAHAKDDISPKELFRLYQGSDADRGIIAKYCIMDCILVTKLMEKLKVLNNNIGMANVCGVPLNYIFMRGQGVKIFSLVSKKCREFGFLIPKITPNNKIKGKQPESFDPKHPHKNYKKKYESDTDEESEEEEVGYEGATVFPPIKGIHYEPIPVLDYASLYPSSMIYMNISHECYVNNPAYDNLENYEYKQAVYNNSDGTTTTCRFAKKKDGTKGVLCKILEELLKKRKETKKLMGIAESEGNYFLAAIYDGLQLAYKITANSLYGQVGAPTSPIYMKELAASTTATGRKMLELARDFIEETFGEIVNLCLNDKEKYYEFMNNLFKDVPPHKFIEPKENRQVMMDYIDYFHARINQLLNTNYKIKPRVIYGDSVTSDTPILLLNSQGNIEIIKIEEIGRQWKDYNVFKSDIFGLTNKQQDDKIEYKVWTDKGWSKIKRVIRHKTNKKIYEIVTPQSYIKVTADHSLLDNNGNQIKPSNCVIGTKLLHNIYNETQIVNNSKLLYYFKKLNGYFDEQQNQVVETNNYIEAMLYYYIINTTDNHCFIELLGDKIKITSYKKKLPDNEDNFKITQINDLGFINDYVYDLETDIGHFHAGVGSMIVKNTDSVFFSPKIYNIETKQILTNKACLRVSIELGILAGEVIGKILPEPEDLEYEKTFWPFIILTKKRYVGNLYETDFESFKQKSMGIVLKRRDNAKIVKIVVGGIVDYILNGKFGDTNINNRNEGAIKYTRTLLKQILQGKFPIDKYIITKTLRSNYKGIKINDDEKGEAGQKGSWYWEDIKCSSAHVILCQRIAERNPGNKPESNDRIPYVYIIPKGKVKLQADRIEDPNYVIEHKIELDYLFYITNQIMKPAIQFLEHIATNPEKIFDNYINKEINRRKKMYPVNDYINDKYDNKNIYSDNNNSDNKKSDSVNKKNYSIDQDRLIDKIMNNEIKKSLTINI